MRLSDDTYEFIKGEVIALLLRLNICSLPISGFEIAQKLGIVLVPYFSLSPEKYDAALRVSEDGFYVEENGKEIIYYNECCPYERLNMTILHEIAHCVLDHQNGTEEEESEAKFFAKYAAAPPPLALLFGVDSIDKMRELFILSYQASEYAFNYYVKWYFQHGSQFYTENEQLLIQLFQGIAQKYAG